MIKITATVEDIQALRPDLTEEQIRKILDIVDHSHNSELLISYLFNIYYPLTKSKPF